MSDPYRGDGRVEELQEKVVKLEKCNKALRNVRKQAIMLSVGMTLLYAVMATIINVSIDSFFAKSATGDRSREIRTERVHEALAAPITQSQRHAQDARAEKIYRDCVEENDQRPFGEDNRFEGFLTLDDPVEGVFWRYSNYEERFIFCALAGERIIFRMKSIMGTGIDPELSLINDGGDELASDDNSGEGNDAALVFAFKKSGRYILELEAGWTMFWEAHQGAYQFSARRLE